MTGERYLVTGASGFIGRHLVRRLASKGEVIAVTTQATSEALPSSVCYHLLDIRDAGSVKDCIRTFRPSTVFHLAASGLVAGESPDHTLSVNVQGTYNVLAGIQANPSVRQLVFTGSWFEYGEAVSQGSRRFPNPTSLYGISKLAATRLVQSFSLDLGLSAVILRPFQVYGPSELPHRLIPHVIETARLGRPVELHNPDSRKDWIYVDDVVEALDRASVFKGRGEAIDIGTGVLTPVSRVVELVLATLFGPAASPAWSPSVRGDPTIPDQRLSGAADIGAAETLLGWKATTSLELGLRKTVESYSEGNTRRPSAF